MEQENKDGSPLPDPTFYPSPTMAAEAPAEQLAYVALLATGENGKKDALGVINIDPTSSKYGQCRRKHMQKLELGAEQQMVLELRPALLSVVGATKR